MARPEDKTILVVDDEKNTREALSKILTEDGYDVIAASDGYQALDLIGRDLPDLILADLKMPGMNGLEGLGRALAANGGKGVALISGTASRDIAEEALNAGAIGFLLRDSRPTAG